MVRPGLINLDFADVRAIMDEMGKAMMGTGEAEGEDRAIQASEKAIANPLLDEISLRGAKGVLINITGGYDLTLFELDEAANRIREEVDPDANIIVGSTLDTELEGKMRVSVVATGIDAGEISQSFNETQMQETELVSDQIVEQADQNLSLEEPLVAKTQEIFDQIDNEVSSDISTVQPLATDNEYKEENGLQAASVASSFQEPSGIPTAETLARLRAAVLKENTESPMPQNTEQPTEIERPKFGISSLISRMSRSEGSDISSEPRKEPNFNSTDDDNGEQDKIEVPAFLRRQAN
jgi:cell division protein FtsZ